MQETLVSQMVHGVTFGGQPSPEGETECIDYFPIGVTGTDETDFGELTLGGNKEKYVTLGGLNRKN